MKVASSRPLLIDSTTVGKSVKRCDSNRVALLVLVAKSVTGHVKWQVTGRKPTFNSARICACSRPRGLLKTPLRHGLNLITPSTAITIASPSIQRATEERNIMETPTILTKQEQIPPNSLHVPVPSGPGCDGRC